MMEDNDNFIYAPDFYDLLRLDIPASPTYSPAPSYDEFLLLDNDQMEDRSSTPAMNDENNAPPLLDTQDVPLDLSNSDGRPATPYPSSSPASHTSNNLSTTITGHDKFMLGHSIVEEIPYEIQFDLEYSIKTLLSHRCNQQRPTYEKVLFGNQFNVQSQPLDEGIEDDLESNPFHIHDVCETCLSKPHNATVAQHETLGPFACRHALGNLDLKEQLLLACISFATLKGRMLKCSACDEFELDILQTSTLENAQHFLTHGHLLPKNSTVDTIVNIAPDVNFSICLPCNQVFPTPLNLLLHDIELNHQTLSGIYCTICKKIVHQSTNMSHMMAAHSNHIPCPTCKTTFHIMDIICHIFDKKHHPSLNPLYLDELNIHTRAFLTNARTLDPPEIVPTQTHITQILFNTDMLAHQDLFLQPDLMQTYPQTLPVTPYPFPYHQSDLIAQFLSRLDNITVANMIANMKENDDARYGTAMITAYTYELESLILDSLISALLTQGHPLPADYMPLIMGPDDHKGIHLLPPSILSVTSTVLTQTELFGTHLITIGTNSLLNSGTPAGSKIRILNMGHEQPLIWPTNYYTMHEPWNIQGSILLPGMSIQHIPLEHNFMCHVRKILLKTKTSKAPVIVEFSVQNILEKYDTTLWDYIITQYLPNIITGFFTGLHRLQTELSSQHNVRPHLVVFGQTPFLPAKSDHYLDPYDLVLLWEKINMMLALYARVARITCIIPTGFVGPSATFYANILDKPKSVLTYDRNYSNYSQHQCISLLQKYLLCHDFLQKQ